MSAPDLPEPSASAETATETATKTAAGQSSIHEREYDRSGFYPTEGKKFRIWAMLGWNVGVIVAFALIAAAINYFALGE